MNIIAAHDMVCRLVRSALDDSAATAVIDNEDEWLWSEADEISLCSLAQGEEGSPDVMEEVAEAARAFARKVVARYPRDVRPGFSTESCDCDSVIEEERD
jgi:hypothetical protein